jgi:putative addiction module component (TIGR02574 family)
MERVDLPLAKLTLAQKLDLIETLWDDISRDEQALDSPAWHEEVLSDRQKALDSGKAPVGDWEEAKARIRAGFEGGRCQVDGAGVWVLGS